MGLVFTPPRPLQAVISIPIHGLLIDGLYHSLLLLMIKLVGLVFTPEPLQASVTIQATPNEQNMTFLYRVTSDVEVLAGAGARLPLINTPV